MIGRGPAIFEDAKLALTKWRQFALGWVELFPLEASIEPDRSVAVLARHLGCWSLNGCRVVYLIDEDARRFGFAYGTLTNHAECGEEIFEVSMNARGVRAHRLPNHQIVSSKVPPRFNCGDAAGR